MRVSVRSLKEGVQTARWHQHQEPLGHRTKGDVPLRTLLFPLKARAEKQLLKYLLCSKCVWLWLVYPRGVQSFQVQISTFLNTAKPLSNVSTEGLRSYKWTFQWLQDLLSEGETNMKPPQQNSNGTLLHLAFGGFSGRMRALGPSSSTLGERRYGKRKWDKNLVLNKDTRMSQWCAVGLSCPSGLMPHTLDWIVSISV